MVSFLFQSDRDFNQTYIEDNHAVKRNVLLTVRLVWNSYKFLITDSICFHFWADQKTLIKIL